MILLLFVLVLFLIYLYITRNLDYWTKRNVKHESPIPLFGTHFKNLFCLKSITEILVELYKKYPNEKVVGYYRGTTPALIIKDPDLIKIVMSQDFPSFYARGLGRDPKVEPLSLNLFHAEGDIWKILRQHITPTFTTAKLRAMFPLIIGCAEKLQTMTERIIENGEVCDVKELMARFTTEFIGACGFGVDMDTINDENSQFRELGKSIFNRSPSFLFKLILHDIFPEIRPYLYVMDKEVEINVTNMVSRIFEQRNHKPCGRNDFIDLLLQLENKQTIIVESMEKINSDGTPAKVEIKLDFMCLVAQAYVFFGAGFETSSSTTSYTLHELAFNPEIQKQVQDEIDDVLSQYDNKLCYDAITKMTLLEKAFKESMRIFPSLGILNRVCTKKFTIPELNITIDPGVNILIPVQAIQMDEKYYDNPTEFRPERFSAEELNKRHKYVYLPFGEGPRACIGSRLGLMQSLAGLAAILHKFDVEPHETTQRHPTLNPRMNIVQGIQGGLPLRLKLRKPKLN